MSVVRSAKRSIAAPDWRAPRNSPGPRISRSRRAISKPSWVSAIARRRSRAVSLRRPASLVEYSSRQADAPRRPTGRAAGAAGQAKAFGMLDHHQRGIGHVDADLDHGGADHAHGAGAEQRHHRFFSAGGMRECSRPTSTGPSAFPHLPSFAGSRWVAVALPRSSASLSSISGQTQ